MRSDKDTWDITTSVGSTALFVPAARWNEMAAGVTVPHRVAARHYDFLKKCDVLVVTNEPARDVASR